MMRVLVALAIGAGLLAAALFVMRTSVAPSVPALKGATLDDGLRLEQGVAGSATRAARLQLGAWPPAALQLDVSDERSAQRGDMAHAAIDVLPGLLVRSAGWSVRLMDATDPRAPRIALGEGGGMSIGPDGLRLRNALAIAGPGPGPFAALLGLPMEFGRDSLEPHRPGARIRLSETRLGLSSSHQPESGTRLIIEPTGITLVESTGKTMRWPSVVEPH